MERNPRLIIGSRTGRPRGIVVTCSTRDNEGDHEAQTREAVAAKLATVLQFEFGGGYDPAVEYPTNLYFVPSDTVIGIDAAAKLGIRGEHDLFGGVVPHAFAATKTITHPLVDKHAQAPLGWSPDFAVQVDGAVLRGYTAFSRDDADRALARLLDHGPARIKLARGIGGHGQFVIQEAAELDKLLTSIGDAELVSAGVVLEEQLDQVTTHSVGQVRVAGIVASYWGTQRTTHNNRGHEVYGGSDLLVVRGGFDALRASPLSTDAQLAVSRALVYDSAADASFAGFFASRRNYDVVEGTDARGRRRAGVLEQSWRIGGASAAEVEALLAFLHDGSLSAVRASTVEIYGDIPALPAQAVVFFAGVDAHVGPITHYVTVEPHGAP
ncbi:MAG TPA: DUF3182 family protein [Casimicrobiaceae bacterium]|jgi:hypothetical protein